MIDLHCHSNFSDGKSTPAELITKAIAARLKILALTDHDTTAGLVALHEAAKVSTLHIVNGIEVSAQWKKHDIHVIGLNIDPEASSIKALNCKQVESRISRAQQIAVCLASFGVTEAYQKARTLAGHAQVGRPHFAAVLINEGFVQNVPMAFKRYLARGKPAYVPTNWASIEEAVLSIHQAGGEAVLAHPVKYKLTRSKLYALIETFKAAGGIGMEVVSGMMTNEEVRAMADVSTRFELLASSGSDYHGEGMSLIPLGKQRPLPENCTPIWQHWQINNR